MPSSGDEVTGVLASLEKTEALARRLARSLRGGDVVLLEGELGAGKTTFAREVARGLGVPPEIPVTSPTFNLVHEYPEATPPLVHADLYRLGDPAELLEIGLTAGFEGSAEAPVVLVEWGARFVGVLPRVDLELRLSWGEGAEPCDARSVAARPLSLRGRELVGELWDHG